jgi:hypothetical protein
MIQRKLTLIATSLLLAASALAAPLTIRFVGYNDVDSGRGITRYVHLAVPNTSTNYFYGVYRRSSVTGAETLVGTNFIGNGGEVQITDVVHAEDPMYFYRSRQEPGFIAWEGLAFALQEDGPKLDCPGIYTTYRNFGLHAPNFGWHADTNNTTVFMAIDILSTNTAISYLTAYGVSGCSFGGRITIPNPPPVDNRFRFSVYFYGVTPVAPYPLRLIGFIPMPPGGADPLPESLQAEAPAVSAYVTSSAVARTRTPLTAEQIAARQAATQAMVDQLNAAMAKAQEAAAAAKAARQR